MANVSTYMWCIFIRYKVDAYEILTNILMQEGPFLAYRLYLLIGKYRNYI